MSVVKVRKPSAPFEVIDRASVDAIKDPVALAVWVFLRCKPEGWIVREANVRDQFGIGRDKYRASIRYLGELGAVEDRRIKGDHGRITGRELVVNYSVSSELHRAPEKPAHGDSNDRASGREPEKPSHGLGREPEKPVTRRKPTDGETTRIENSKNLENSNEIENNSLSDPAIAASDALSAGCPHKEIIDLYHHLLPEAPKIVKSLWSGSSDAKALQSRWRSDARHRSMDFWERFFLTVRTNPHWMGYNDRGWKAGLRWLVKLENFIKVVERMVDLREVAHG